jgi:hypothetical protein
MSAPWLLRGIAESGTMASVTDWSHHNSNYKKHLGDAEWLMRDALRRAVDMRDTAAKGESLSGRGVMLVAVLNALKDAIGMDAGATGAHWLWSDTE